MTSNPKLALGIPHNGRPLAHGVGFSWLQFVWPTNVSKALYTISGQPVDTARELIALRAHGDGVRYLLFLDDDIAAPPDTIRRLLTTLKRTGAAAVGGVYYAKCDPTEPIVYRRNGEGASWDWEEGEVFEVEGIGTGCLMIDVQKMATVPRPWFQFVEEGPDTIGEDIYFCSKVREAGFKVLCDSNVICVHHDVDTGKEYGRPEPCAIFS